MRTLPRLAAWLLLGWPATAWGQMYLPGRFRLTEYWIASEAPPREVHHEVHHAVPRAEDRRAVRLTDRSGTTLAWVGERFASSLAMEGTGRTWDGRLLNWDSRVGARACFVEMDTALYPYGAGVQGYALVPFRSLAVDGRYLPLGHTVEIAELAGVPLPDGSRHDGCFVAVDGGGAIRGHHIDLFVPSYEAWSALGAGGWLPEAVHAVVDSPRCTYARRFAVLPLPGDPVGLQP